jgi:hypothetical protein
MTDRRLIRGVIADVRARVPGVARDRLAETLAAQLPGEDDAIRWELDLAYGPPPGLAS